MITRFQRVSAIVAVVLVIVATPAILPGQGSPAMAAEDAATSAEAARLIGVLQSDAEPFDKAKACQAAAHRRPGRVPGAGRLLADEKLGTYARSGLEPIPDPERRRRALRSALGKLQGQLLVGVINPIGVRRDEKAVGAPGQAGRRSRPGGRPKALAGARADQASPKPSRP